MMQAVAFPNPPMLCVDKINASLPAHPHKLVLATPADYPAKQGNPLRTIG